MTQPNRPLADQSPETGQVISTCPVCDGRMEMIYSRGHQDVSVCADCGSDLTVPTTAWEVLKQKQQKKSA